MKLRNEGGEFQLTFGGKDYTIPSGDFEIVSDKLAFFVINKSIQWGKRIVTISEKKEQDIRVPEIVKAEEITKEEKKDVLKEEVKTETKTQIKEKKEEKKDTLKEENK